MADDPKAQDEDETGALEMESVEARLEAALERIAKRLERKPPDLMPLGMPLGMPLATPSGPAPVADGTAALAARLDGLIARVRETLDGGAGD